MERLLQDLIYGLRIHRKTITATLISILTVALGIGASTAVFSVVNAVLLKPVPYPDSGRIVIPWRIASTRTSLGYSETPWNLRSYRLFTAECKSFQEMGAFRAASFNLTGTGMPLLLEGMEVSSGFFTSLGVSPLLGRTFSREEEESDHEHELILSYQLWQETFSGDRSILGRKVDLNGFPYTVVGVMPAAFNFPRSAEMPAAFDFPEEPQFWTPLVLPVNPPPTLPSDLALIGKLRPGVKLAEVQEEFNILATRQEQDYPKLKGTFNARVTPLTRQVAGNMRQPLLLILGAVGVVLLIACANVANLFLAQALGRSREFTVRAALGAAQGRLLRQILTESLLLALVGGTMGMLLSLAGIQMVKAFGPSNLPRLREVGLDFRVFAFALAVTVISGILMGLGPALAISRKNLTSSLKEGGSRSARGIGSLKFRKAFLVSEVALAFVLVVAAGLLVRTFYHLLNAELGFNSTHVLTFQLSLPESKYADTDQVVSFYRSTLDRLRNLPEVQAAGIVYKIPMGGSTGGTWLRTSDQPVPRDYDRPFGKYTIITPGYFAAIGTPLLRGRDFLDGDTKDSLPVAVINSAMARKLWPGVDPIGKQVAPASKSYPLMTIVGIVADVKRVSFREEPGREVYVPYSQKVYPSMLIMQAVLRTKADPASATGSARQAIHSVDPDIPVANVMSLETVLDNALAQPRFSMLLLGLFGAVALLLAAIGTYGVISYSVTQRTQEIGIRIALGAGRRSVLRLILSEGGRVALLGGAIGLALSWALTRLMSSFLYGVGSMDPLTFGIVTLVLFSVALLACYLPAHRATRIDPVRALRIE